MNNILLAKEAILKAEEIILTAHTSPDGDAIGSLYGLYLALKKIGKKPLIIIEEYNPRFNIIMNPIERFTGSIYMEGHLFISLDCGAKDRFMEGIDPLFDLAETTINIDHHISNDYFGDINIVETDMTSASEVVFNLITELVDVDTDIMSSIYAGIVYDSGGFKYNKVTSYTHKIASIAHDIGVDCTKIYSEILGNHTMTEISVFAKALANIKFDIENKIIYTYITQKEILEANSNTDELGAIVSYLLNTEGFLLSIFIYEKENNVNKVSLRSKKLDVNLLASYFGGGGHQLASGCKIEGDISEAISKVLLKAKELIRDEKFV